MTDKVKPIPDGYHSITPYLIAKKADDAVPNCRSATPW